MNTGPREKLRENAANPADSTPRNKAPE